MTPQEKLESVIKFIDSLRLLYGDKLEKLPEKEKAIFADAILGNQQAKNVEEVDYLTPDAMGKDLTVYDLMERYGLSRCGMYNRIRSLKMSPAYYKYRLGFFTREQVSLLDKFDKWMRNNYDGRYSEFCLENNIY